MASQPGMNNARAPTVQIKGQPVNQKTSCCSSWLALLSLSFESLYLHQNTSTHRTSSWAAFHQWLVFCKQIQSNIPTIYLCYFYAFWVKVALLPISLLYDLDGVIWTEVLMFVYLVSTFNYKLKCLMVILLELAKLCLTFEVRTTRPYLFSFSFELDIR